MVLNNYNANFDVNQFNNLEVFKPYVYSKIVKSQITV
jgi:hypothetical protein